MSDSVSMFTDLLKSMVTHKASDLFIHCGRVPQLRIFGEISQPYEETVQEAALMDFIKSELPPIVLQRLDEERDIDIGYSLSETERYRLNIFYQKGILAAVIRRVPLGNIDPQALMLPELLGDFAREKRGIVLITGSTGSGKSTTMAALLNHINENLAKHIITVEDPIEFVHQDKKSVITQREVGSDTNSFGDALKHVVRQSPDAIFIGELRDIETIQTAISAAMTGHLVVTTMHTTDPLQTLERILGYFPEHLEIKLLSTSQWPFLELSLNVSLRVKMNQVKYQVLKY